MSELDHLVFGVPDLHEAVAWFESTTGVAPTRGGRHPGRGTANYLVSLGNAAYLEIIGPDKEQLEPVRRPLGRLETRQGSLLTWAVRSDDLEGIISRCRKVGYDAGEIMEGARELPDGRLLEWRLTFQQAGTPPAVIPFIIDWGDSAHPSSTSAEGATLASFVIEHPDPGSLRPIFDAMNMEVEIREADPGLVATLDTPKGPLVLR